MSIEQEQTKILARDQPVGNRPEGTQRRMHGVRNYDIGVPDVAAVMNDTSEGDGEYVERMFRQIRNRGKTPQYDPSKYYYGRPAPAMPPIDKIRNALERFDDEVEIEPGTEAYMRARFERRVDCPFGCFFDAWSKQDMIEHLKQHREIRRFEAFWSNALEEYDGLLSRRRDLRERLDVLKNTGMSKKERSMKIERIEQQYRVLQARIRKFETSRDTAAVARRQKQYNAVMNELLYN